MESSYVYVDAQPLCMRVHSVPTDPNIYEPHWYVHDRLGSVRQVVKLNEFSRTQVENRYAYTPFGEDLAAVTAETIANPFQFTGQWYDAEIGQYYLRARQYDPTMMRFISRDSADSVIDQPLTNHRYLYCMNNSINALDPDGEFFTLIGMALGCAIGDAFGKAYDTNIMIKGSTVGMIIGGLGGSLMDIYLAKFTIQQIRDSKNMDTIRDAHFYDPNADATQRQEQVDKSIEAWWTDFTGQ